MQSNLKTKKYKRISLAIFVVMSFFLFRQFTEADIVSDIKNKIDSTSVQIQKLQEEIKADEVNLNKTTSKAASLKNELEALTLSKKKLETDLSLTQKKLEKTTYTIDTIVEDINETEQSIDNKKEAIKNSINDIRLSDDVSVIENLLASRSLVEVTNYVERLKQFSSTLAVVIHDLEDLETDLSIQKTEEEIKKTELKKLQTNLSGQKKAVQDTASEKDRLLLVTKNQEANYKKMLEDKIKLRAQFETELFKYESELKIAIDTTKLPKKGAVLSWPLEKVFLTQQFGQTSSSGRLYASGTHNGIDLRASDGTKVLAALLGTVQAVGNTDAKAGCYSYGKWVLLKHPNGLSTLYGHLSSVSVSKGDSVSTGDIIGYSGRTGYVTGPHLHFTVLATEGVRVMPIPTATNCNGVTIPIGDPKAFLDPLLYLSKI